MGISKPVMMLGKLRVLLHQKLEKNYGFACLLEQDHVALEL